MQEVPTSPNFYNHIFQEDMRRRIFAVTLNKLHLFPIFLSNSALHLTQIFSLSLHFYTVLAPPKDTQPAQFNILILLPFPYCWPSLLNHYPAVMSLTIWPASTSYTLSCTLWPEGSFHLWITFLPSVFLQSPYLSVTDWATTGNGYIFVIMLE